MKPRKKKKNILDAEDKFCQHRETSSSPKNTDAFETMQIDLEQLGFIAIGLLNQKSLEVSKVRPFFWSMVETYVDRFQQYPFDTVKALFNYLELANYPADEVQALVRQLETQFEKTHGRPLRKSTELVCQQDALDDEVKKLRDSLKYAAMVAYEDD